MPDDKIHDKKEEKEVLSDSPSSESQKGNPDEEEAADTLAQEEWSADHFLHKLTPRGRNAVAYHPIIREEKNRKPIYAEGEPYAEHWKNFLERATKEEVQLLKRKLHGKILIDLGGGISFDVKGKRCSPSMQEVVQKLGVAVYVNVDRNFGHYAHPPSYPKNLTKELRIVEPKGMHIAYTENDMLEFIMQMKDTTPNAAFALNGVDRWLIPGRAYHELLAKEITRVLPRGGVVLTCGSEDAVESYEWRGLDLILGPKETWPAYPQMWEKK